MEKRVLIYLPVIHTPHDMGDLSDAIRKVAVKILGKQSLRKKDQLVNRIWTAIEQTVESLDLTFDRVRLYQDGLPVCGRESDIVADLSGNGSRNHQLLVQLIQKGATLMGTESPGLLLEEYQLVKQTLSGRYSGKKSDSSGKLKNKATILLKKRDQFIAERINNTLLKGETGILFLGMLHDLQGLIDTDIAIDYPITKPFSRGGGKPS